MLGEAVRFDRRSFIISNLCVSQRLGGDSLWKLPPIEFRVGTCDPSPHCSDAIDLNRLRRPQFLFYKLWISCDKLVSRFIAPFDKAMLSSCFSAEPKVSSFNWFVSALNAVNEQFKLKI